MTFSRFRLRPGTHSLAVTAGDCDHYGQDLTSQLTESIVAAALARHNGDVERAKLHQEAAFRVLMEAQREARR